MRKSNPKIKTVSEERYKEYVEIHSHLVEVEQDIINNNGITEPTYFPQFFDSITMEPTEEMITIAPTNILHTNFDWERNLITSFVVLFFCGFLCYSKRRLWFLIKKPKLNPKSKNKSNIVEPMLAEDVEMYQIYPDVKDDWNV